MVEYILIGSSIAFTAAVQPGPLQAFLVSRVASSGWKRTLPACLAPLISDIPIALIALLVLDQLSVNVQHGLRASGGVLLLYFAYVALRQFQRPNALKLGSSAPRTLMDAVMVNLLNPNPYIGWSLVLGPPVLAAWREQPMHAVVFVGSFYGTMVTVLALFIYLVGTVRFLGSRGQRILIGVSVVFLAGLGLYFLFAGVQGLKAGLQS
jgi:threonine/homoserine/homoserine lactone efflux protein